MSGHAYYPGDPIDKEIETMSDKIFKTSDSPLLQRSPFAPLTYLASPYSYKHSDPETVRKVQGIRFETCTRAAGWCLTQFGWNVFSPITHSHPIHVLYPQVRGDWPFWKKIDTEFLQVSKRIVVLTIPGWEKSTGGAAERKIAAELGLELFFVAPHQSAFLLTKEPQSLFE